jgi:hypothetical protein
MFADWTDRIKAGEVPPAAAPARWHRGAFPRHPRVGLGGEGLSADEVSTDRRDPTRNNGLIYGSLS